MKKEAMTLDQPGVSLATDRRSFWSWPRREREAYWNRCRVSNDGHGQRNQELSDYLRRGDLAPIRCNHGQRCGLALSLLLSASALVQAATLPVRPDGITPKTEQAITKGLAYLARTQNKDGSWRSTNNYGTYPCTMTSLAGLSLMAGGHTPSQGKYALNVRRAVDYVLRCAGRTGLIARIDEEQRPMYSHGFGMLFLAESVGMEADPVRQRKIQAVLTRGVRLTAQSQSRDGGWLYTPDSGGDEGSVTVTQIQGLRACRNAGIKVPKGVIKRACEYINKCSNKDGGISYSLRSRGSSRPAITAAAVATLYNAGDYDNPVALRALDFIKKRLKGGTSARVFGGHWYYSNLYAAQAFYLSGEKNWATYFPKCREAFLKKQAQNGSWGGEVGETYCTAIALLCLQLPYRYLPILQR